MITDEKRMKLSGARRAVIYALSYGVEAAEHMRGEVEAREYESFMKKIASLKKNLEDVQAEQRKYLQAEVERGLSLADEMGDDIDLGKLAAMGLSTQALSGIAMYHGCCDIDDLRDIADRDKCVRFVNHLT